MIEIRQMPLGPLQTNCYLLSCDETGHAAIIDPSWNGRGIMAAVDDIGLDVKSILLTHAHFDHVGGLGEVKQLSDAPVYIHPDAVDMLSEATMSAAFFGIKMESPPPPDELLQVGQQLTVGNLTLDVMYTPGHAPGHVSFHIPAYNVLFSGDVLFQGSIGRTDLPGGDMAQLLNVIHTQLMVLPDSTQVFSGHGNPTTIGAERKQNPFLQQ